MLFTRPKSLFQFICQYKTKDVKDTGPTIQELENIFSINNDLSGSNSYDQNVADIANNRHFTTAVKWLASKGVGLKNAVTANDESLAKTILEHKADVNNKEPGEPILHIAIKNANYKIIKMLLEEKADPNVRGSLDKTPLHIAAEQGDLISIQFLFDYQADPSLKDYHGKTSDIILKEKLKEISRML